MEPFVLHNPVKLHFGKNCIENLPETLSNYGKKILFMYGKTSIKKSGLYEDILDLLANFEVVEFSGIKSNPVYEDVDSAAKLGREKNVDMILAVGGGSVIDSAKMTSITIPKDHSVWDFFSKGSQPEHSIPLINVLTLSATGTEMNPYAVLQNNTTGLKRGYGSEHIYPKHSFLDPSLTTTVPKNYTAYGIVDLVAHALEQYFGAGESTLSDKFVFSVIKEAIEYGPKLIDDLENYELREKIMWAATVALNGWLNVGRKSGDWGVHGLEHSLSVLYDVPHGAGLSICYPAWLKYISKEQPDRILELGKAVFNATTTNETIHEFENFFEYLKSPIRLSEININKSEKDKILENMNNANVSGSNFILSEDDRKQILEYMF